MRKSLTFEWILRLWQWLGILARFTLRTYQGISSYCDTLHFITFEVRRWVKLLKFGDMTHDAIFCHC